MSNSTLLRFLLFLAVYESRKLNRSRACVGYMNESCPTSFPLFGMQENNEVSRMLSKA